MSLQGYGIQSGVPWTDSSLPARRDDVGLTKGHLILHEARHSSDPMSGAPINGTRVPNIAWRQASAILGAGDATTLSSTFNTSGLSSTHGLIERTGKGGLHAIVSQSADVSGDMARIDVPAAITAYIYNHTVDFGGSNDRQFYYSAWTRITRQWITGGSPIPLVAHVDDSSNAAKKLAVMYLDQDAPASGPPFVGHNQDPGYQPLGNVYRSIASQQWTTARPAAAVNQRLTLGQWGGAYAFASSALHKAASYIHYRTACVDLVALGLSYATMDAFDHCLYQAAVLSANKAAWLALAPTADAIIKAVRPEFSADLAWACIGARYYGDTFTDPATIP